MSFIEPRRVALAFMIVASPALAQQGPDASMEAAASAFPRLVALAGDWIDVDGSFGVKGGVAISYRVTGNGSAVIETLFPGRPHEMVTVYHRDRDDLVLTHYCAAGNQPRMRARTVSGNRIEFQFDGGTNLDPARDGHMHSAWIEFVSENEIQGAWIGWKDGKPSEHEVRYHVTRAKG